MKRTQLLKNIPSVPKPEDLGRDAKKVYGISQVAKCDQKQYLNIDLYYMGELQGRYFADEEGHVANVQGRWNNALLENVARLCMGKEPYRGGEYYVDCFEWNSNTDDDIAREYLGCGVDSFEWRVNQKKYQRAYERKVKRIDEEMAKVPLLPEKLETWLQSTVFQEEYIFTEKKNNRVYYGCTACSATSWRKKGWKNNEQINCPKCGHLVRVKNRKKRELKAVPVVVMQIMDDAWVERQLTTRCSWSSGEKKIEVFEEIRAIIPRRRIWGKVYYGQYYEQDENEQDFWTSNRINRRWKESLLYPENLKEVYAYNGWCRNGMETLAEKNIKFNVNRYVTQMRKMDWAEYLVKAGLIKLVRELVNDFYWGMPDCINESGTTLREFLKLNGDRTSRMRQIDGNLLALQWLQYEQKKEKRITQETLTYLMEKKIYPRNCEDLLESVGSVNRMVNYLKKQKEKNALNLWDDYMRMAREEGFDVTDDIVRLPRNLRARHDELVEIRQERADRERMKREKEKYKKLNGEIFKHLQEAARFYWENDEYAFIPAGKCEELIKEGRELHHCVGSSTRYMEKMAEGSSWIIFLRKKDDLNEAYYTLEMDIKKDEVIQFYSKFDRQPDKEKIQKLLKTYKEIVKRRHKKAA